jgi:signal transduction histidine kinase/ligand-binding sensor domain-containing protein/DNA-binding response OmpR family regulator
MFSLSIYSQTGNYKFRRLDTSDGLSNNQIQNVFVDSRGFAWFSSISGLNRYDGYTFKVFRNNPNDSLSLSLNSVTRIYEDYKGFLWLFSFNNEMSIYNPVTESFTVNDEVFSQKVIVPRTSISSMLVDRDSMMWIANFQFGIYRFNPKTKEVAHLVHRDADAASLRSDQIVSIASDSKGNVWAVNRSGLLEKIDRTSMTVIDRIQMNVPVKTDDQQLFRLFIDAHDDLWIYSVNDALGLFLYQPQTKSHFVFNTQSTTGQLSSNLVSGMVQDSYGKIWVGTDHGGINLIDKQNFNITVLLNEQGDPNSLSQNSVKALYKDRSETIWVGTYKNGVCFYHPGLYQFKLYQHNPFEVNGLPSNDIDCFAEDKAGNLWIGTNGNGLIYYDRKHNTFKSYRHQPNQPNGLSNDVIVSMCVDHLNRLWLGTYFGGLNMFDGEKFTVFRHQPDDPRSISDDRIWQIIEDSKKRLWFGTLGGGLDLYDQANERFTHYRSNDLNSIHSDFILALAEGPNDELWIGTSIGVDVLDHQTGRITYYTHESGKTNTLSNGLVLSILTDKRGWVWIGTRNGLNCFDRKSNSFRLLQTDHGLPDNNIISLEEDKDGRIWMSTLNGIASLRVLEATSPLDFTYQIKSYDLMDGLQGKEFNEHAGYQTRAGEILFGGMNGFNMFIPDEIKDVEFQSRVVFTDLKLQNKSIKIGESVDGSVLLNAAMSSLDEIELKHNQNIFSIEFSALNYLYPEKVNYRYKLEGFNDDWITTDAQNRLATYTNLNPGEYVLRVIASGSDGNWNHPEARMHIRIVPPFYATHWAIGIYFIVLLGLIILLVFIIRRREHLKYLRQQERQEHQRMHDLDAMKIKFFTNVSHEFRTPLTLILTPLDKLMQLAPTDEMRTQLQMVQRNGKRLLNLVNQLLDFRKMEVQNIPVNPSYSNIIAFLHETADSFNDLSESKNIRYHFSASVESLFMWFDHDKMEKILFNLMSNAFKFTPANGLVSVTVDVIRQDRSLKSEILNGADYVELRVMDTGIGIEADKLDKVFDRFFQNEGNGILANQGSGIGLALTHEFVRLHNGTIAVESAPEKGSTFIVRIPVVEDTSQKKSGADALIFNQPKINLSVATHQLQHDVSVSNSDDEKPLILIVEDNEDLRFYLKENLRLHYRIEEASNGEVAWMKTRDLQPTLVVTDVMMPVMDGLDLCRKIKQDEHTSHIPVVMLTARTTHEQKVEGLESGADDYLTKPFSYEILEIKIRKLIEMRRELHKTINLQYEIKPGEIGVTSMDEKFIQRALDLVEKNISNSDFSVERMSRELGVSRGHLYNKTMALTGKTPIEFIRIMRLKRAAQLLAKSQLTVAEIAYEVGFNDPKYFSKYFKEEFQLSPSEYSKKMMGKA